MKTLFTKTKRNEKGFSLIELMIVVAIIGVLAAIAVPTFQGFQKRAKAAEAKQVLGSVYTGQSTYNVENSDYALETACSGASCTVGVSNNVFTVIGLEHVNLKHYSKIGFAAVHMSPTAFVTTGGNSGCTISTTAWKAGAVSATATDAFSVSIDQAKTITQGSGGTLSSACVAQ